MEDGPTSNVESTFTGATINKIIFVTCWTTHICCSHYVEDVVHDLESQPHVVPVLLSGGCNLHVLFCCTIFVYVFVSGYQRQNRTDTLTTMNRLDSCFQFLRCY